MMKGPINMAINPPVDATKTPEWAALQKHYDELQSEGISLKQWFADDAERVVLALREHRMFLQATCTSICPRT